MVIFGMTTVTLERETDEVLDICMHLERRSAYVQYYIILVFVAANRKIRLYKLIRKIATDYYQTRTRMSELVKKKFVHERRGQFSITAHGLDLIPVLGQVIARIHGDDVSSG